MHALLLEQVEVSRFAILVLVAVAQEDREPIFRRAIFRTTRHVSKEGVGDVENDEADAEAATGPQLPGRVIANETEFVNRGSHLVHGTWGNLVRTIENI